jgi:glycerophosphoryl diester phosphodiesterase
MKQLVSLMMIFLFVSCEEDLIVIYPDYDPSDILTQTTALTPLQKNVMEGIYQVIEGSDLFGDDVVLKWSEKYLSIFTSHNAGVIILEGGIIDTAVFFKGFWRQLLNERSGAVDIVISGINGAAGIISGDTSAHPLITGAYGTGNSLPDTRLRLRYIRPLSPGLRDFYLISHRGGGRNSDMLGSSENTIEMISKAERLGANGIEIDVRLSTDGVHFLYHDPDINLRLTQKSILKGQIEDYSFPQLRTFITLKNGELIPSLEEALEFILLETRLKFVWLDLKSQENDIAKLVEIRNNFMQRAVTYQREIEIFLGIPEDYKAEQLKLFPGFRQIPTICELQIDKVSELNSVIWASRWTEGLQTDEVLRIRAEGKKSVVWTLDQPEFIRQFIEEGEFDGVLSNYTPLVAYYHYSR